MHSADLTEEPIRLPGPGEPYSCKFLLDWIEFDRMVPDDANKIKQLAHYDLSTVALDSYLLILVALFASGRFRKEVLKHAWLRYHLSDTELEQVWSYMFLTLYGQAKDKGKQHNALSMSFFIYEPMKNQLWTAVKKLRTKSPRADVQIDDPQHEPADTTVDTVEGLVKADTFCRAMARARRKVFQKWQRGNAGLMYWLTWALIEFRSLSLAEIQTVMDAEHKNSIGAALQIPYEQWKDDPFVLECNCLNARRPFSDDEDPQRKIDWTSELLQENRTTTETRLCKVRQLFVGFSPRAEVAKGQQMGTEERK